MSVLLFLLAAAPANAAPPIAVERFGMTADGRPVSRIVMTNDRGMRVGIIDWGATVTRIDVPDHDGRFRNVALSLPDIAAYERSERRWSGVIGRYAGRIADASFTLDGTRYRLEPGRNGVTLHGGGVGYDRRRWRFRTQRDARSTAVIFTLTSPAGDQGFPGSLTVETTYRLSRRINELRIDYRARTTAPTPFNPTNHLFVNLAGAGQGTIGRHRLRLFAARYAETDARKIPTGRLLPVAGTPLDFRVMRAIDVPAGLRKPLLAAANGYDHGFVLRDAPSSRPRPAALLEDPASGRRLSIATTEPSIQFNSGQGFDGRETGAEGIAYPAWSGVALETQHLSDSPNQRAFPTTILRPGRPFRSTTIYRFSLAPVGRHER